MATQLQPVPAKSVRDAIGANDGGRADIDLIHSISVELIGEQDRVELYGKIVDAAVAITGSQFGTMQLLCTDTRSGHAGELQLLAHRGLPADAVAFWQWVGPAAHSSCTAALKAGERAVIPDFEQWDQISGTEDLLAFRRTGIRSAQTTPLIARGGELLGMISTHWDAPHQPSERDLRLLDILARQAADLLERTIAEEELRARGQELDRTIATLRETEALQKMLTGELSHRVKNMLATVQAIASQTLRHSEDSAEFVESFDGRIQSMARVHSQLSDSEWKGAQLHEIVRDQMRLGPVDEKQIEASGPPVHLDATMVPTMAMILHELGTNSLKYGALSRPGGTVAVKWTVIGQSLEMGWSERGGPQVAAPFRSGFGTRLITSSALGVGGEATMSVGGGSVRWAISLPLSTDSHDDGIGEVAAQAHSAGRAEPGPSGGAMPLTGKRILVVEDEPLLAIDIAGQLEDAGAQVIGPAGTAAAALALIEQFRFDAALLDANLAGTPVDEIAASLTGKHIPFAFVSGYGRDSLPQGFADTELLPKPFGSTELIEIAARLAAGS